MQPSWWGRRRRDPHSRVRSLVADLDLPSPWTIDAMVDTVAARTGRRLVLHPLSDLPPEISGVTLPAGQDGSVFAVCYDARSSSWTQHLIILHELGHHLLEHLPRPSCSPAPPRRQDDLPQVSPDGLARASFTRPQEIEAEWFATLMIDKISRVQRFQDTPHLDSIRRGLEPPSQWTGR